MKVYLMKRLVYLLLVLLVLSVVVFAIVYVIPGDPATVLLGDGATPEAVAQLQHDLGLTKPIYEQYGVWISKVVRGDLGTSYFLKAPVAGTILERIGPTLSIAVLAELIAVAIAVPLGIFAARRRASAADRTVRVFTMFGMTVPSFLLGLFMMLLFAVQLKWLPVAGYKSLDSGLLTHLRYIIMPAVALGVIHSAFLTKITRASMLEVLNEGYIKTARAKGVKERRVIYRHTLRNSFIPILTVIGQSFGTLIAGAAVVESIFNIPGLGQLLVNSVQRRDYMIIQGAVLLVAVMTVVINLIVDLLYVAVDPRIRLNK
ncbi:ABC transporter permease [Paenibacillaceae bacterium]|nr:ABC transporter permease [Paenibacillaceae bacterium]